MRTPRHQVRFTHDQATTVVNRLTHQLKRLFAADIARLVSDAARIQRHGALTDDPVALARAGVGETLTVGVDRQGRGRLDQALVVIQSAARYLRYRAHLRARGDDFSGAVIQILGFGIQLYA